MPPRFQQSSNGMTTADTGDKHNQGADWWDEIHNDKISESSFKEMTRPTLQRGAVLKNEQEQKTTQNFQSKVELEAETEETPLISLDVKSPLIWTIGCPVLFIIIFICELVQNDGFEKGNVNPLFGPSVKTMILLGAKSGPDIIGGEFWRYYSAIFLHNGVLQLLFCLLLAAVTYKVEYDSGYWRAVLSFIGSGSYGYILSTLIIPAVTSCGSTCAYLGFCTLLLCDILTAWSAYQHRAIYIGIFIAAVVISFLFGLSPYMDNFANIGGIIMGFLISIMILPNMTYSEGDKLWKGIVAFLAFPVTATIYCMSMVIVFRVVDPDISWCKWCQYANCINVSGWCPKVVDIAHRSFTYENYSYLSDTTI